MTGLDNLKSPGSPCGTYGAVQRHRKAGEPLDDACKKAARDYHREYRKINGPERDRWYVRTRNAALQRLSEEYPERLKQILAEIRAAEPFAAPEQSQEGAVQ